ncbi:MAG TPA: hypothetical protein VFF75_03720 [Methylophilaceae bacterium]|nr:hypothetical protein [Methylophilaceae bacterium]
MKYSQRLSLLYALCVNEFRSADSNRPSDKLEDYAPLEAATYLACYISFKAIQQAERSPADERIENFDMLSVYQAFAMLVYAYLTLPLGQEEIAPNPDEAAGIIVKSLFAELNNEELVEVLESGMQKFRLIAGGEQEYWANYREDLDKAVIALVVAGTEEGTEYDKDDLFPIIGALLTMLCEAFESE